MPVAQRLANLQVDTTADANGYAVVRFNGPGDAFDQLRVEALSCRTIGGYGVSHDGVVTLYRGRPGEGQIIAVMRDVNGTFSGGAPSDVIGAGEVWALEFAGCAPGAAVTVAMTGTIERRPR